MLFGYSEQLESAPSLLFSRVKTVKFAFMVEIRYCFLYAPAEVSGRVQFLDRAQNIVHQADEQCDRAGVHAEVFREGPEAAVYHVLGDVPRQVADLSAINPKHMMNVSPVYSPFLLFLYIR